MSTVRRDFRASPYRTNREAWEAIAHLLAPADGSAARNELVSVSDIAAQLISTECAAEYPIIAAGSGPRVRVYCIYNEDALDEDTSREEPLAFDATTNDWKVSIPAEAEDLAWSGAALARLTKRISVREKTDSFGDEAEESTGSSAAFSVDVGKFLKS